MCPSHHLTGWARLRFGRAPAVWSVHQSPARTTGRRGRTPLSPVLATRSGVEPGGDDPLATAAFLAKVPAHLAGLCRLSQEPMEHDTGAMGSGAR